jgi:hypothetical protein
MTSQAEADMRDDSNAPPVVKVLADQSVNAGVSVKLDGSGSSDPGARSISFAWKQVSGPQVALSSTSEPIVTFTAPANATTLGFELMVSNGQRSSVTKLTISVRPPVPAAQIKEVAQQPVAEDPVVKGALENGWTLKAPVNMPRPPDVDPKEGAFALLSAVQFAPVAEIQLSPAASHAVGLQVSSRCVLLGTVRWVGTNSPLKVDLTLDASSLPTGRSHSLTDNRGGVVFRQEITRAGQASLSVTNTAAGTVKVRMVLGALNAPA